MLSFREHHWPRWVINSDAGVSDDDDDDVDDEVDDDDDEWSMS